MGVVLPPELAWVFDLIDFNWPNIDEDEFRDTAHELRELAKDLENDNGQAKSEIEQMLGANKAPFLENFNALWQKLADGHLQQLGEGLKLLGTGLDISAVVIEGMKVAAIVELGILAAKIIAAQAAAIGTFGASEALVAAQTAFTQQTLKRALKQAVQTVEQQLTQIVEGPAISGLERAAGELGGQLRGNALVAVTDPVGGTTRLGWTVSGQLAWLTRADGATEHWTYDGEDNEVEHVDLIGGVTRTEYGAFDLPVAQTDPTGARTTFTYDTEQRLTSVTNPAGLTWSYQHDAAGNVVAETDFNGRTTQHAYDAAGRLVARTNGVGQTVSLVRDALGRVVERRAEDGATAYVYDHADRLIRAANADTELVLTRDPVGRVLTESCGGRTLASTYDSLGRRVGRRTPSGVETRWDYDTAGRPTALHALGHTLAFGYDHAGREISRRLGGATLTQSWDANHRLHTQALAATGPGQGPRADTRLVQRRALHLSPR
jgi:YD repeat-containing protein